MKTIYFPGKFQPPHIGHILTISKLLRKHYHVIVGISEDEPRIMTREQIEDIFRIIFGERVYVHLIDGVLTDWNDVDELPLFDVLMSGNDKVLEWGKKLGLRVEKTQRSEGIGCSGKELRRLIKND